MIKVTQLYPQNVDGITITQEAECEAVEDIYNIPFVQRWMDDPTFYKLCKSTSSYGGQHLLIAQTNRGKNHWVIAKLEGDINSLIFPEWQQSK